jgi:hypothetical protein
MATAKVRAVTTMTAGGRGASAMVGMVDERVERRKWGKRASPWSPSHGQQRVDASAFIFLPTVIFCTSPVLFGVISLTVLNFDGPSATRKECHIYLAKKESLTERAYTEHKNSPISLKPL